MGPAPPPVFGSKIEPIPPPKVAVIIQHQAPKKLQNMITKIGRGFESRRCHKNFTKKTFFPISKNVNYGSVAYPWPKL
jgi:hypothetical protein